MAFLDELREWLSGPRKSTVTTRRQARSLDVSLYRRVLFEALGQLELEMKRRRASEVGVYAAVHLEHRLRELHDAWSKPGVLELFVETVHADLLVGIAPNAGVDEMRALVADALRLALLGEAAPRSFVQTLELQRIAHRANPRLRPYGWADPERYARELGLTRPSGGLWSLTSVGETLLGLTGRAAVRWLLTVECMTATGPDDEFRACRGVFRLLDVESRVTIDQDQPDARGWPFADATISRLEALEVALRDFDVEQPALMYVTLRDDWAPFVKELAEGHMTPFASLAETLLARESEAALRSHHLVGAVDRSAEIVAAQVRHTKMVVHEIRNALVPVQHALRALYAAVEGAVPAEEVDRHRALIDPGIDRLFHFVAELKQTADLAAKLPDPFDPLEATREAVAIVRQGLRLDVTLPTPAEAWRVRGDRNRFVLACVNLLRNAAQASTRPSAAVHVEALHNASGERLVLAFDDDGPGVPETHRETIFQSGFALRAEGTGQGLALVREVVEAELGGVVRCEASTKLGGARFVVVVPIDGRTEP